MVSSYFVAAFSALTLSVPSLAATEFDIKQALTARSVDLGDQTLLQSGKDGDSCAYAVSPSPSDLKLIQFLLSFRVM